MDNSGCFLVPGTEVDFLEGNPLQNKEQLLAANDSGRESTACGGQLIGALFEALVVHRKAIAFKVQELYLITPPVQKDKHGTVHGIELHLRGHHTTQRVKAFAHVTTTLVEIVAALG